MKDVLFTAQSARTIQFTCFNYLLLLLAAEPIVVGCNFGAQLRALDCNLLISNGCFDIDTDGKSHSLKRVPSSQFATTRPDGSDGAESEGLKDFHGLASRRILPFTLVLFAHQRSLGKSLL